MDSRILGIVGGVLLIIGVFCPLVGVDFGVISQNFAYIGSGTGVDMKGLILILLGIAGIGLAVVRKYKLLLVPGILALAILVFDYLNFKSKFSEVVSGAGSRGAEVENAVSMKWGWIVLLLGALALLAAGAMGKNLPAPGAAYGAPPPPPPYTPGR